MGSFAQALVGSVVGKALTGGKKGGGGAAAAAPAVQPKPVVRPAAVVGAGVEAAEKKKKKGQIRRGAPRQRIPTAVMGTVPTETKTLLGQ